MTEEMLRLQRIGWLFRAVNVAFREGIDAALRRGGSGLGFGQVSTLSILDTHPGINGAQLARHNMVTPQAMTGVLRQLAAKKLIERREHPDSQRADSWHLTPKGQESLARGRAAFAEVTRQMLGNLKPAQVAELETLLAGCHAALEGGPRRESDTRPASRKKTTTFPKISGLSTVARKTGPSGG
jgi:DNA-binding MarR family transcriptional regulator